MSTAQSKRKPVLRERSRVPIKTAGTHGAPFSFILKLDSILSFLPPEHPTFFIRQVFVFVPPFSRLNITLQWSPVNLRAAAPSDFLCLPQKPLESIQPLLLKLTSSTNSRTLNVVLPRYVANMPSSFHLRAPLSVTRPATTKAVLQRRLFLTVRNTWNHVSRCLKRQW